MNPKSHIDSMTEQQLPQEIEKSSVSAFGALSSLKKPLKFSGSEWNQDDTQKRKSNPVLQILIYTAATIGFFLLFFYLTFPSLVLRETVATKATELIQQAGLPIRVSIGQISPYWFTGISLKNVQIVNITDSATNLKFGEISGRAEILPLFTGKISVKAYIAQAGGSLEANVKLPILGVIKGAGPSSAKVSFKSFALDSVFQHAFAIGKASKNPALILVQPLLANSSAGGNLTGSVEMENPDPMTFSALKGFIRLNVASSFLHINDETLQIPKQSFEKAKLDITFGSNSVQIGKETAFQAEDIGIELNGQIGLPDAAGVQANANLNLKLIMKGQIEKSLGFIVPNMLRCKQLTNGELNAVLAGPLTNLTCT